MQKNQKNIYKIKQKLKKLASKMKMCGVEANDASKLFFANSWKQLSTWTHSHAKFPFLIYIMIYTSNF